MDNIQKIENLYNNVNYIITGTEDGWLKIKGKTGQEIINLCYILKTLSEHSCDELFKFEKRGMEIY